MKRDDMKRRDPDSIGFKFDPFEGDEHGDTVHYEELLYTLDRWRWIDKNGKEVDLRKANLEYLANIIKWIEEHHNSYTPYKDLPQYGYCSERLEKLKRIREKARLILRRKEN